MFGTWGDVVVGILIIIIVKFNDKGGLSLDKNICYRIEFKSQIESVCLDRKGKFPEIDFKITP